MEIPFHELYLTIDLLVLAVIVILSILIYKWIHEISVMLSTYFGKISDRYYKDSKDDLAEITDSINRLSSSWGRLMMQTHDGNQDISERPMESHMSSALDDLLNRYGSGRS